MTRRINLTPSKTRRVDPQVVMDGLGAEESNKRFDIPLMDSARWVKAELLPGEWRICFLQNDEEASGYWVQFDVPDGPYRLRGHIQELSDSEKKSLGLKIKDEEKVICPKCQSHRLRYVMRSIEYHSMWNMLDEDGNCQLNALHESHPDESFTPYLECDDCHTQYNLDRSEKK